MAQTPTFERENIRYARFAPLAWTVIKKPCIGLESKQKPDLGVCIVAISWIPSVTEYCRTFLWMTSSLWPPDKEKLFSLKAHLVTSYGVNAG